jgi:hypothetical protein
VAEHFADGKPRDHENVFTGKRPANHVLGGRFVYAPSGTRTPNPLINFAPTGIATDKHPGAIRRNTRKNRQGLLRFNCAPPPCYAILIEHELFTTVGGSSVCFNNWL